MKKQKSRNQKDQRVGTRAKSARKRKAESPSGDSSTAKLEELRAAIKQCRAEYPEEIERAGAVLNEKLMEAAKILAYLHLIRDMKTKEVSEILSRAAFGFVSELLEQDGIEPGIAHRIEKFQNLKSGKKWLSRYLQKDPHILRDLVANVFALGYEVVAKGFLAEVQSGDPVEKLQIATLHIPEPVDPLEGKIVEHVDYSTPEGAWEGAAVELRGKVEQDGIELDEFIKEVRILFNQCLTPELESIIDGWTTLDDAMESFEIYAWLDQEDNPFVAAVMNFAKGKRRTLVYDMDNHNAGFYLANGREVSRLRHEVEQKTAQYREEFGGQSTKTDEKRQETKASLAGNEAD